jgi:hypothetical protein
MSKWWLAEVVGLVEVTEGALGVLVVIPPLVLRYLLALVVAAGLMARLGIPQAEQVLSSALPVWLLQADLGEVAAFRRLELCTLLAVLEVTRLSAVLGVALRVTWEEHQLRPTRAAEVEEVLPVAWLLLRAVAGLAEVTLMPSLRPQLPATLTLWVLEARRVLRALLAIRLALAARA